MKKPILVIVAICFVYLSFITISTLTQEHSGFKIEDLAEYNDYLEEISLDPKGVTPLQKKMIYENRYEYIKDIYKTDYICPSINPLMFSRDWSVRVNEEEESPIKPIGNLFKKDNHYIIILSFEVDYSYNSNPIDIGYIDILHSNNYYSNSYSTISYVDHEEEYRLSDHYGLIADTSKALISQNQISVEKLIYPKLLYTYFIEFTPSDDNNLTTDMYFECDLDFYISNSVNEEKTMIGFNEFTSNDGYYDFTATRRSTYYNGGEE